MGRLIGIAWDTGDMFTLKVWSKLDGKWQHGRELNCNVVRPRAKSNILEDPEEELDLSKFSFQKLYRTNKLKRNK